MLQMNKIDDFFICIPPKRVSTWSSHMMAPVIYKHAFLGTTLDIFFGGWNRDGISAIYSAKLNYSTREMDNVNLVLERGLPGTFDENGVFPGAAVRHSEEDFLTYTGFQLGQKIPHYNFAGIAKISPNNDLERLQQYPILDRADEGLFVRSGLTYISDNNDQPISVYAAGSSFEQIHGKLRPNYEIYTQSKDPMSLGSIGRKIIAVNNNEHGIGRPYLAKYENLLLLFYTRRMRDFKYKMGIAFSDDNGSNFIRCDELLDESAKIRVGLNDEMQYFPAPFVSDDSLFIAYNGNNFGKDGIGVLRFQLNC